MNFLKRLGSVTGSVLQTTGRSVFKDGLRTVVAQEEAGVPCKSDMTWPSDLDEM